MRTTSAAALVALLLASAGTASAQQVDPRWSAWLGCWQLLEERGGESDVAARELVMARGAVVCVAPKEGTTGVRLTTAVEGQSALEETMIADGTRRPFSEPGCDGWQQAEWSASGLRIFARAALTCGGTTRELSGLGLIGADRTWTDVQVVKEGTRESIRVRRYRRAPSQARSGLRPGELVVHAAATARQAKSLSIEEIKEAAKRLPPSAIEAAIIDTDATFPLNRKRLVELSDAGVPARVIDLMVATSFPDHFVVQKRSASGGGTFGGGYGFYDSDGFYDWPYYYAPFGYSLWGRYDTYYYGSPGFIVINNGGGAVSSQPSGDGRVVDGLGYTRVRSREPIGTAASGDYSGSGGTTGQSSGGTSSSGGGSITTSGYSGGGSGDGGRTAVSRPPR